MISQVRGSPERVRERGLGRKMPPEIGRKMPSSARGSGELTEQTQGKERERIV